MHVPYGKFKSLLSKFPDPDGLQIDRPVSDPNRPLVSVGYRDSEISVVEYVHQDPATTVYRRDRPDLVGNRLE
jgi:hypothetical protein